MSTPFSFVPRTVARPAKVAPLVHAAPRNQSSTQIANDLNSSTEVQEVLQQNGGYHIASTSSRNKATPSVASAQAEDYAILICLAMSDYAIWLDADLRRTLEQQSLHKDKQDAGFVPLSYIVGRISRDSSLGKQPQEANVAKALRAHAQDILDIRMLVSTPSSSLWYDLRGNTEEVGGYEVRRKDRKNGLHSLPRGLNKTDWEEKTIYVENISSQCRTIPGIVRFVMGLFLDCTEYHSPCCIQHVSLPPHHLDKPEDIPKYRERWPWKRPDNIPQSQNQSTHVQDAQKSGLRTLSKVRWDELNTEYLDYRRRLMDNIVQVEEHAMVSTHASRTESEAPIVEEQKNELPPDSSITTTHSSPYPYECLVFVRNIHPETNRTTLRTLFSKAFDTFAAKGVLGDNGIDYVDFNKGMDSCFLRLSSSSHTKVLADHFAAYPTMQQRGLDDAGRTPGPSDQTIIVELVQGKKEEVYWEKVPEKIRKQAVQKALAAVSSTAAGTNGSFDAIPPNKVIHEANRHKKRKRD